MKKILNQISDLFVFWNLKKISNGYLNLTDSTGKERFFGDKKSFLRAKIKINDPSFCYKILRKGSSGLGESYINGEFEIRPDHPSPKAQHQHYLHHSSRFTLYLDCNTQIKVNNRLAVLKSVVTFPSSRDCNNSDPSLCKARRPISMA